MTKQIAQIKNSMALRLYGAALALVFLVNAYEWFWKMPFLVDSRQAWNVCYPFFPRCELYRFLSYEQLRWAMIVMAIAALATSALFVAGQVRAAWWALIGLTLFKTFFYVQDYQLIHNLHYMFYFLLLIFLFFPRKEDFLSLQIVLFYFAASLLKFNREWLEGYALLESPPLTGFPLRLALHWAVILECVLVWGLFAKRRAIRFFVLAQLILFHAISWQQVGYFYPVSMFLLLTWFALREWKMTDFDFPRAKLAWLYAAAFVLLQILPKLGPGDFALDGRKRYYSLFMLDATVRCTPLFTAESEGRVVNLPMPPFFIEQRLACDPVVIGEIGRSYCRRNLADQKFDRISVHLSARRSTDERWTKLIEELNFCGTRTARGD